MDSAGCQGAPCSCSCSLSCSCSCLYPWLCSHYCSWCYFCSCSYSYHSPNPVSCSAPDSAHAPVPAHVHAPTPTLSPAPAPNPAPLGIFNRVASLKSHDVTDFCHSSAQCESKNTWVDPHHLLLGMFFHLKTLMGITMGNKPNKTNMLKKALSDGPNTILRPLYNSNVAKVNIVKWSQNNIFVASSSVSRIPKKIQKYLLCMHFSNL